MSTLVTFPDQSTIHDILFDLPLEMGVKVDKPA